MAGDEMAMLEKRLPGGEGRKRQRRGLRVRDALWLPRQVDGSHRHEFRRCSVARKIRQAVHFISKTKIVGVGCHALNHARDFMSGDARDSRRAVGVLIGLVPGQLGGRDACGKHSYEHISSPNLRRGCILEKQLFRSTPVVESDGFHRISPLSFSENFDRVALPWDLRYSQVGTASWGRQ